MRSGEMRGGELSGGEGRCTPCGFGSDCYLTLEKERLVGGAGKLEGRAAGKAAAGWLLLLSRSDSICASTLASTTAGVTVPDATAGVTVPEAGADASIAASVCARSSYGLGDGYGFGLRLGLRFRLRVGLGLGLDKYAV